MKIYFLWLFCLIILAFNSNAQDYITVQGKVVDAQTHKGVEYVHVKVNQRNIIGKTQKDGTYSIRVPRSKNTILVFSHTSYETVYEPVSTDRDTIELAIEFKLKLEKLPVVTISDEPQVVFKSTKINIADYEFYQDKFLFLVYGKRLNKDSEIYLVDQEENIIAQHYIPGEPVELYCDYMGNVNLICKKSIFRVMVNGDHLQLYELPLESFNQLIKPVVDTLEKSLLFSDFMHQFPRFKYYAFDKEDTSVHVIKEVVHKDMDWRYNFEYHFLNNADKQFAKRMAKRIKGYDKYDVAAHMTGFANSFLFDEIYAPLFVIDDTINIFDHYEDKIWKYIHDTVLVDSISFDYHKPAKKNSWKKELIMDETNGKVYGLFQKNGYYTLKAINPCNGKVGSEKKLYHQFVEKVKIKDGFVYYTYKPSQSLTKKFLYKEPVD